ncbi:hypothetical protein BDV96DRAFT_578850 [Lophiotrema nucula]|uniref:Uncharacterized protein n=1 Tax=Lophiotrema nucula TaxID=690887 RepID=A0A6A5Z2X2_9PLEO|nr:hypothetical protein BDV96DRAFT_578850 [Lophiotrema nucula]
MPRPKRTKVASTTARVAKPLPLTKAAPAAQKPTKKPDLIESFSDDSDGLVTKATRARRRRPLGSAPQSDADFTMTGALPANGGSSSPKSRSKRRSSSRIVASSETRTPTSVKMNQMRQARRDAKAGLIRPSPAEVRPAVESHDVSIDLDDSLSLDNLLSFDSLDSDSPAHGTRPPSAMKVGGTPAHETSILALTNFRRRPRQPSLLRMVHRTTDVEDNDLDDLDDLDNFNPADESTPLHERKGEIGEDANHEDSGLSLSSVSSRGKKRKLSSPVIQVPRSSPTYDPPSGADVENSHRSSSPSLPEEIVQSTEDAQGETAQLDPEIFSETMAPPRSSSPMVEGIEDSPEPEMSRQRRTRKTRKMTRNDAEDSDDQPDAASKPKARRKAKANNISTAKLQALLPRRRTHISVDRDVYDLERSDDASGPIDSDQDELQMPASRLAGRDRKSAAPKTKTKKKTTRRAKQGNIVLEPTTKPTRTYGRRTSSDKENESSLMLEEVSDDDDVTDVAPKRPATIAKPAPNLTAITQKFAEIDEWEMDFEDVDANGTSSSPWR